MNIEKPAAARNSDVLKQVMLARARVMSASVRVVEHSIDEVALLLASDLITPEQAADDLWIFEQLPVFMASFLLVGSTDLTDGGRSGE